ncbi:MAG: aminotransferase [Bacteroidota bacterium]
MILKVYWTVYRVARERRKRQMMGEKPRLVWGPVAIINNKYYSQAMAAAGYCSKTYMEQYYNITKKADFDMYFTDFAPKAPKFFALDVFYNQYAAGYSAFCYCVKNFDVFHHPFSGGFLQYTRLKRREAWLLKKAGCKVVTLGYGADFFRYSKVIDASWLHGLNAHYPAFARNEDEIERTVSYWRKHSDCIINGLHIDQLGRWDVLPFRNEVIDLNAWRPRENYSDSDGLNGPVTIVHAPNHRVIKGTEFLLKAVDELKKEGLQLNLILLEKRPNDEVKSILHEQADIFFDQSVLGYALSAIEGFASGLPVMTNLEIEEYTRVFRRYSFLNECPALSTSNESIKSNLRILVRNPGFRRQLGEAGRKYAEKYHSYATAANIFGKIYDKIWHGKDQDLINIYHPLLSTSYNNSLPLIEHPLVENKIPRELMETLNK